MQGVKEPEEKKVCGAKGCEKKMYAKEYCYAHYLQVRAGKEPREIRSRRKKADPIALCQVKGCERKMCVKGYCRAHYLQVKAGKEPREIGSRRKKADLYVREREILEACLDEYKNWVAIASIQAESLPFVIRLFENVFTTEEEHLKMRGFLFRLQATILKFENYTKKFENYTNELAQLLQRDK